MSSKITLELNPNQVEKLVEKLSLADKIRLVRRLETQTWGTRLDEVTGRISKSLKAAKISDRKISQLCAQARQNSYNASNKSRH